MKTFIVSVSADMVASIFRQGWSTRHDYGDTRLTVIKGIPKSAKLVAVRASMDEDYKGAEHVRLMFECPDEDLPTECAGGVEGEPYVYFNPLIRQEVLPDLLTPAKAALPVMGGAIGRLYIQGEGVHPTESLEYLALESAVRAAEEEHE